MKTAIIFSLIVLCTILLGNFIDKKHTQSKVKIIEQSKEILFNTKVIYSDSSIIILKKIQ